MQIAGIDFIRYVTLHIDDNQSIIRDKTSVFKINSTKREISLIDYQGEIFDAIFYPQDATLRYAVQTQKCTQLCKTKNRYRSHSMTKNNRYSHYVFYKKKNRVFALITNTEDAFSTTYRILQKK